MLEVLIILLTLFCLLLMYLLGSAYSKIHKIHLTLLEVEDILKNTGYGFQVKYEPFQAIIKIRDLFGIKEPQEN